MVSDTTAPRPSTPLSITTLNYPSPTNTSPPPTGLCRSANPVPTYTLQLETTYRHSNHAISADLPQPPSTDQSLLICPNIPNPMLANPSSVITDDDDCSRPELATPNTASEIADFFNFLRNSPSLGDSLSILLINARSLAPKLHCLQALYAALSPSLICVTETWLAPTTSNTAISIPGYSLHRTDRQHSTGGGCAIYSKTELAAIPITDPDLDVFPDSAWVTIIQLFPSLLVGCIYNPPPSTTRSRQNLTNLLTVVASMPYQAKAVMGDFNLPDISWTRTPSLSRHSHEILSQLSVDGWQQLVLSPTRAEHILDLIFSHGTMNASASVGPLFPGSDHKVVTCSIQCPRLNAHPSLFVYHYISPNILSAFASIIRSSDWTDFFLQSDTQLSADIFYSRIAAIINSISPLRTLAAKVEYLINRFTVLSERLIN